MWQTLSLSTFAQTNVTIPGCHVNDSTCHKILEMMAVSGEPVLVKAEERVPGKSTLNQTEIEKEVD